jgi:glycogen synthase
MSGGWRATLDGGARLYWAVFRGLCDPACAAICRFWNPRFMARSGLASRTWRKALRICFVTPEYALHPPYGGIATYTRQAARWLAAHGHEVHVILVSRVGPHGTEDDAGVIVNTVPTRRIRPRRLLAYAGSVPGLAFLREAYAGWNLLEDTLGAWKAVDRLSRPRPFDVIEVADFSGLGFWGTFRPGCRAPILVRSHGYVNLALRSSNWAGARFQLALERYSVRHADFVLAVSAERVQHYRAAFGVDSAKIGALVSGISIADEPEAEARTDQPNTGVTILYIGRVELRKGCDILFEALKSVHQQHPWVRAVFVGPIADNMQRSFADFLNETTPWVRYQGVVPQQQVVDYLRQGDMIVLPSRFESLPRVLIEALAAGVPQIASSANGIPEIVEDGVTGFIVDPITPEGFAEAILRLSSSANLRALMSQRSRDRALAKFEINTVMEKQVLVYRALAAAESPHEVLAGQS